MKSLLVLKVIITTIVSLVELPLVFVSNLLGYVICHKTVKRAAAADWDIPFDASQPTTNINGVDVHVIDDERLAFAGGAACQNGCIFASKTMLHKSADLIAFVAMHEEGHRVLRHVAAENIDTYREAAHTGSTCFFLDAIANNKLADPFYDSGLFSSPSGPLVVPKCELEADSYAVKHGCSKLVGAFYISKLLITGMPIVGLARIFNILLTRR